MVWNAVFIISIAQGLFLISLLMLRHPKNRLASRFLIAMISIMVLTNLGYLVVRTELINIIPHLFAVPLGMIFLFGPLFYFYMRSLIEPGFRWKNSYWLHFIPYLIQAAYNFPFYILPKEWVSGFLDTFLSGNLLIQDAEKISFLVQDIHLSIYLYYTYRFMAGKKDGGAAKYVIPLSLRINWVKELFYCFSLFLLALMGLYIFVLFKGKYVPATNYSYTLITSCIIYFIAYRMVLKPELIGPDFSVKYRSYLPFEGEEGNKYLEKINTLLSHEKIFTNPDLSLSLFSEKLGLPPHQVSKLINEKFSKSFNDLINEYRVNEFISKVNQVKYRTLSIYGIALEVGFNSKSTFNTAFKKITGSRPSDYRKLNS